MSLNTSRLDAAKEHTAQALTLAVCSNRIENIKKHWRSYLTSLCITDTLLIVLDLEACPAVASLAAELVQAGAKVIINGRNLGLSLSRNVVLGHCQTNYLVFVDDDVVIPRQTVASIRLELVAGAEVVGVRISGPEDGLYLPWYISEGQFHYLAIHNPWARNKTTWGACMALNLPFTKATDVKFRIELGRRGRKLQCGDDTTFLRELRERGAKESFLTESHVFHNFNPQRLSLIYMLRRAYWQGRTEFRRGNSVNGLRKEWARFFDTDARVMRKAVLALIYICPVLAGILREWLGCFRRDVARATLHRLPLNPRAK
jgi:glycosyltransferase involved in cell wall biosynthesis